MEGSVEAEHNGKGIFCPAAEDEDTGKDQKTELNEKQIIFKRHVTLSDVQEEAPALERGQKVDEVTEGEGLGLRELRVHTRWFDPPEMAYQAARTASRRTDQGQASTKVRRGPASVCLRYTAGWLRGVPSD